MCIQKKDKAYSGCVFHGLDSVSTGICTHGKTDGFVVGNLLIKKNYRKIEGWREEDYGTSYRGKGKPRLGFQSNVF